MKPFDFLKSEPQKVEDVSNEPKSVAEIFEGQIKTGLAEHDRSNKGLFISALSAGLELGFTLFLSGLVLTLFSGVVHDSVLHVLLAFSYPIGFIFVVIGRSELFTEHTTLAVIPVLNKQATAKSLLKVWGIIYIGNLIGGYIIGAVIAVLGPEMEIITVDALNTLAHKMTSYSALIILGSSVLAGWLMGLLSWLVTGSQETISRILMVFLITSLIGLGGLHHSIVGSIEVFSNVLRGGTSIGDYFYFQWWTTIGNIIGGTLFVAIVKYYTIKFSRENNKVFK